MEDITCVPMLQDTPRGGTSLCSYEHDCGVSMMPAYFTGTLAPQRRVSRDIGMDVKLVIYHHSLTFPYSLDVRQDHETDTVAVTPERL
jgi:hypothetical protein